MREKEENNTEGERGREIEEENRKERKLGMKESDTYNGESTY